MDRTEDSLENIGLTKQESRVYLALLQLQEAKTGEICRRTKIASSNIYNILDSLTKKGLASFRIQNNIKIFMPSNPEVLNELFLEKQRKLEEEQKEVAHIISELKKIKIEEKSKVYYKYYGGISGIKAMWHEINELMNKEYVMKIYAGRKGSYERLVGFFTLHHQIRKQKKVKEQLLFPKEDIQFAKKRKDSLTKIRFMKLDNDAEWGVWKDIFYIHYYPINKNPYGFLMRDPIFAKTFDQVFNQLWGKAKNNQNL